MVVVRKNAEVRKRNPGAPIVQCTVRFSITFDRSAQSTGCTSGGLRAADVVCACTIQSLGAWSEASAHFYWNLPKMHGRLITH